MRPAGLDWNFTTSRRLAAEVEQLSNSDDDEGHESYSDVNFAYGSTPFESWLKVSAAEERCPLTL